MGGAVKADRDWFHDGPHPASLARLRWRQATGPRPGPGRLRSLMPRGCLLPAGPAWALCSHLVSERESTAAPSARAPSSFPAPSGAGCQPPGTPGTSSLLNHLSPKSCCYILQHCSASASRVPPCAAPYPTYPPNWAAELVLQLCRLPTSPQGLSVSRTDGGFKVCTPGQDSSASAISMQILDGQRRRVDITSGCQFLPRKCRLDFWGQETEFPLVSRLPVPRLATSLPRDDLSTVP